MKLIIKSKKLGREIEFRASEEGGYLRTWDGDHWRQSCEGGSFYGSTIKTSPDRFKDDCRKWYRAYVRDVGSIEND